MKAQIIGALKKIAESQQMQADLAVLAHDAEAECLTAEERSALSVNVAEYGRRRAKEAAR